MYTQLTIIKSCQELLLSLKIKNIINQNLIFILNRKSKKCLFYLWFLNVARFYTCIQLKETATFLLTSHWTVRAWLNFFNRIHLQYKFHTILLETSSKLNPKSNKNYENFKNYYLCHKD